jgi:hypothetical protein
MESVLGEKTESAWVSEWEWGERGEGSAEGR